MIIDGNKTAQGIFKKVAEEVAAFEKKPHLVVVLVGEDSASKRYVSRKQKACNDVGIRSTVIHLPEKTSAKTLEEALAALNEDSDVHGILLQLPLPKPLDAKKFTALIKPEKDVDGLCCENMGKLLLGDMSGFIPCTPLGIQRLLKASNVSVESKKVVIVGRSAIVGKPLAALLMQNAPDCNATVTLAHSKTKDLKALTQTADILIVATGSPALITEDWIKEGAVVIDVGITEVEDLSKKSKKRLVGDVDFKSTSQKASLITPVPGGVGPMTIASLLTNTVRAYQKSLL